jgi:hypothetical protein
VCLAALGRSLAYEAARGAPGLKRNARHEHLNGNGKWNETHHRGGAGRFARRLHADRPDPVVEQINAAIAASKAESDAYWARFNAEQDKQIACMKAAAGLPIGTGADAALHGLLPKRGASRTRFTGLRPRPASATNGSSDYGSISYYLYFNTNGVLVAKQT